MYAFACVSVSRVGRPLLPQLARVSRRMRMGNFIIYPMARRNIWR